MTAPEGEPTKYCQTCGERIHSEAVICPECGVEQPDQSSNDRFFSFIDAYPLWAWLAGILLTVIFFGWGMVALVYFAIKGSQANFEGQSTIEIGTVLALALLGVLIVEYGGEAGTRKFWRVIGYFFLAVVVLSVLIVLLSAVVALLF